jgi:predicted amidohydrolase YtcJ
LLNWRELADLGIAANFGTDFVRIGGVKGFIDGSLGSSTAKFFDPYQNEPDSTGIFVTPPAVMRLLVRQADVHGLSVAIHAIGDQGNAEMLTIFREVSETNGPRDRRFRIEHAQHLRTEDIPRFADLKVIASMQPYHAIDDGRWAEQRIGAARCATSYAYRSLIDAGVVLAFGSDWSVAPLNPLLGIDAAVNRRTVDGKHPNGWFPGQRITVAEALKAYTYGSAYAAFQERSRGRLAPGFLGDCVILSRDILDPAEQDALAQPQVLMTVVGGKVVFEPTANTR